MTFLCVCVCGGGGGGGSSPHPPPVTWVGRRPWLEILWRPYQVQWRSSPPPPCALGHALGVSVTYLPLGAWQMWLMAFWHSLAHIWAWVHPPHHDDVQGGDMGFFCYYCTQAPICSGYNPLFSLRRRWVWGSLLDRHENLWQDNRDLWTMPSSPPWHEVRADHPFPPPVVQGLSYL